MTFIVDASVVGAWLLQDEPSRLVDVVLDGFVIEGVGAPDLLTHEIRNVAVKSVQRGRVQRADAEHLLQRFQQMRIRDAGPGDGRVIVGLALRHKLTPYDAAYLALAKSEHLPLATLDKQLRAAARAESVPLLPERL